MKHSLAFLRFFIFVLTLSSFLSPAETQACVRYIWADTRGGEKVRAPVYACSEVINKRAESCMPIGSMDLTKVLNAKKRALEQMWAFTRGIAVGFSCQLGVTAMPLIMGPLKTVGSAGIAVDRTAAKAKMRATAHDKVLSGKREPGAMPDKEDIVETNVTRACNEVKRQLTGGTTKDQRDANDAFNMGVDSVLSHFASSAAMTAVLAGDALAIEQMYQKGTIEREEAVKKFHARIERERKAQEELLQQVKVNGEKFYHFMLDNGLETLHFGTQRSPLDNDLKCIDAAELKKMKTKLCDFAKATAKMQSYEPGDLFKDARQEQQKKLEMADEATRKFVQENCKGDVTQGPGLIEKAGESAPSEP